MPIILACCIVEINDTYIDYFVKTTSYIEQQNLEIRISQKCMNKIGKPRTGYGSRFPNEEEEYKTEMSCLHRNVRPNPNLIQNI